MGKEMDSPMKWASIWGYESLDFGAFPLNVGGLTHRLTLYNFPRCEGVRIRFQNKWGRSPLRIGRACVSTEEGDASKEITVCGAGSFAIEAGECIWSDPASISLETGQRFQVVLELEEQEPAACACTFLENDRIVAEHFEKGDGGTLIPASVSSRFTEMHPDQLCVIGMDRVAVLTDEKVCTVAAFGDSITHMSRYTVPLSRRLLEAYGGRVVLMNCGICGNRLLHDASTGSGHGGWFGPAGLGRFEKSVFNDGFTADRVILLEGVNDILHPAVAEAPPEECVSAEEIVQGLEACADIAHRHGVPVYVGTLMPFNGCKDHWRPWHEEKRLKANQLIKASQAFDGLLDFDLWTRDPKDSTRLDPEGGSEDKLHPGIEGGRRMAEHIPLEWLADD